MVGVYDVLRDRARSAVPECVAQADLELAWREPELGDGLGVRAPIGDAVGGAHDLAQVRRDPEEGATVGRQSRTQAQHGIRDRETRWLAARYPGGDPHPLAESDVRSGKDVCL